jgi:hypothetical protein
VDLAEFEEKIDKTAALNQARAAEDYGDDYFGSDGYNDDDLEGLSAVDDPF